MIYEIENDKIKISASTYGGELHSIILKDDYTEYLWDGNPNGWKYHAPILFPIVGRVKDGNYKVDSKEYKLPQHGLARISEFKLLDKSKEQVSFQLKYSNESLEIYPFKFLLNSRYSLKDNTVKVQYEVKNLDKNIMQFSIGAHPAFMCPLYESEDINDYYFEFSNKEDASIKMLNIDGLIKREEKKYLNSENIIRLNKDIFKNDALIFSNLKSDKIALKSTKNNKEVVIDFSDFPFLGLWAPQNGARFVCIEPWFGHSDYEDFNLEFKDKEDTISLKPDEVFRCSYTITIK